MSCIPALPPPTPHHKRVRFRRRVQEYGAIKALQFWAGLKIRDDAECVGFAVQQDGRALICASERLKDNEKLARLAIAQTADAFKYASSSLRGQEGVLLCGIGRSFGNLKYLAGK